MATPKTKPFTHRNVTIEWTVGRTPKAEYKELNLEIRGIKGMDSKGLYIDGSKRYNGGSVEDCKQWACEYLKGM
ncbi:hypothetical protein N9937_00135 [bacterium]|nr:hypothetical protein [bacterium]